MAGGKLAANLEIPEGARAVFIFPDGESSSFTGGEHRLVQD